MRKGRIANYDPAKGFGFIKPDEGTKDLFFDTASVKNAELGLSRGALVEYEEGPGRKPGERRAARVVITQAAAQRPPAASGPQHAPQARQASLPAECVFTSFYKENQLSPNVFYQAPQAAADVFRRAGLKSSQFRQLYQGFLAFAAPLRDNRLKFPDACDRFGVFYCERIVRQSERGILPPVVKELIDVHRETALRDRREMLALFRYLANIYCYFGESDKN